MRREEANTLPQNDQIRVPEVRLIDEHGEMLGIMPTPQALALAREREVDLVLISPQAQPPVAKLADAGKLAYQREKLLKKQRAAQKNSDLKTIKLSVRIGENDFNMRVAMAEKFLSRGDKVRVEVQLRGREKAHPEVGREVAERYLKALAAVKAHKIEQPVKKMGGVFSAVVTP